eukprot:TRINITY_DN135639_c0_g1_i1.p1 TRINITY_DN135639_c0_g1~~TRINITY_DN135639_c0_g1_i1.p1  ORF type:complete len:540 (-),score=1.53 TRINITY_DN135639_c0_g1_i1:146-1765(-)
MYKRVILITQYNYVIRTFYMYFHEYIAKIFIYTNNRKSSRIQTQTMSALRKLCHALKVDPGTFPFVTNQMWCAFYQEQSGQFLSHTSFESSKLLTTGSYIAYSPASFSSPSSLAQVSFLFAYSLIEAAIVALGNQIVVYFLLQRLPRKTLAWKVIIYCLTVTGLTHIYRMITNYGGWDMSISELFMVQTVHFSYLAWDYSDAVNESNKNPKALKNLPSLLEHLAAGLCPSQCLGGPEGHLQDFLDYIYFQKEHAIPISTIWPAFEKIMYAIGSLFVYLFLVNLYPTSLLHTDYASQPFYVRVYFNFQHNQTQNFYLFMVGLVLRVRYYVPFKFMEAAVTISGQSFNGYDKSTQKPKFDKVYSMDIDSTEFGIFHRAVVEEWNRPVQFWLKWYIHTRVNGNPYLKTFFTFFVSAVWHGFYPMYFFGFAFYSVSSTNYNFIYKLFVRNKALRKPIFYWLQYLYLKISVCYFTSIFAVLLTEYGLELTKGALWIPVSHLIVYVLGIFFNKRGTKPKPEWEKYSKLKIYNCAKGEAILSAAQQ